MPTQNTLRRWTGAAVVLGALACMSGVLQAENSTDQAHGSAKIVLLDGKDLSSWTTQDVNAKDRWKLAADAKLDPAEPKKLTATQAGAAGVACLLEPGGGTDLITKRELGDGQYHVEFLVAKGGNSGVYLLGRYEVQIFDSFGKDKLGIIDTGAIYNTRPPSMNASKPAGEWQTFDINFRGPRFDASGKKTKNALFVSVKLNGKLIQENVDTPKPTGVGIAEDEVAKGPLMLQGDHGPVAYRNIWHRPAAESKP